jgi:hypothetical protein
MEILVWFLLNYGLMNIMVFGSIFEGLRNSFQKWGDSYLPLNSLGRFISGILSCPMCFSVWSGFFLSLTIFSPTFTLFGTPLWISWFFDGILSSGAVWIINSIVEWYERE